MGFVFILLFVAFADCAEWFSVPYGLHQEAALAERLDLDYRGCFGVPLSFCLVVSNKNVAKGKHIKSYIKGEQAWVTSNNGVVFGEKKPQSSDWVARVPLSRVSKPAIVKKAFGKIEPNPVLSSFLSNITKDNIKANAETLAKFHTRNSLSEDAVKAGDWIEQFVRDRGCQDVKRTHFKTDYSPNVECRVIGSKNPNEVVIVGAHYDCRSTDLYSKTQRAPGADDNGSGSSSVMEMLRAATLRDASNKTVFSFEKTLVFAWFSGEEQGLYGSEYMAQQFKGRTEEVVAMINLDMIGWQKEPTKREVFFDKDRVTVALRDLGRELSTLYLPGVEVGLAEGCCSDGDSFYQEGMPVVSYFESAHLENPHYHRTSDEPGTVSYQHVEDNARSAASVLGYLARISENS